MPVTIGERLGSHEITALIGKGGMGEVYRARDTKLKRDVAIKTLPGEFSRDPDRLNRFQREAEVLASLNHPNIAAIYGLEEFRSGGSSDPPIRALVLELVEGDTLADAFVKRGALPLAEAFDIARQICEALEAAHDKGIVHRDLKPANVKVMPDGTVKVLDFGLAKLTQDSGPRAQASVPDLTASPTLADSATHAGLILGTAAYMSPEQARGRAVDRRSDIFAFGCVLFEMLTGRRAFGGDDVTEVLSRVVTGEPDWSRLPADTPRAVRRLLQRALKKDPRQRLGDIRDARFDIEEGRTESTEPVAIVSGRRSRLAWGAFGVALLLAFALSVPAVTHLREARPAEVRLEINTPFSAAPLHFALSPDGRHIVFVASDDGPQRLWLRALDKTEAQSLPGTEGAEYPFWSRDSRSIGFFGSGKLQRINVGGTQPQRITDAPTGRGGTWNADGTILFSPTAAGPLFRVAASGGEPTAVTELDSASSGHRYPQFLPDGNHFLFFVQGVPAVGGIYLASLDGRKPKRVAGEATAGVYLPPGLVVYVRDGALVARRLDVARAELTGEPMTLADRVGYDPTFNFGAFSISDDGRIAYRTGAGGQQLTWYDRAGRQVGVAGELEPDTNALLYPELSPDGRRVAVTRTVQNNTDIWLIDLTRGGSSRVTTDPAVDNSTVWSPDGSRVVFSSSRRDAFRYNLHIARTDLSGTQDPLLETPSFKIPQDWSKDGRFLLFFQLMGSEKTGRDLWALDLTDKEAMPQPVANSRAEESLAQFSPDGRWVAYQTNESGRFEVVVQAFPDADGRWPVSTNGGQDPRWRADSRELYFIAPDRKLMAATVSVSGSTFESGTPVALFPLRIAGGVANMFRPQYDVANDGRFLVNQLVEESTTVPITLLLNWTSPD